MWRTVTYTVRDQFGAAIWHAWWEESFSNASGPGCASLGSGDVQTDSNGVALDLLYWEQSWAFDGWSNICSRDQTITIEGCPEGGAFWANNHHYTEVPMITVTPQ